MCEQDGNVGDVGVDTEAEKKDMEWKKRNIQLRVNRRTTIAELKKKLEDYVGVESAYFKLYRIYTMYDNQQEYEMERLTDTLMSTPSESKIVVRLGRALLPGEHSIKLYLLRVNHQTKFFKLMMESIVTKNTPIKDFKKQIEKEAKKQGVECELKANKMRLRKKVLSTPGTVYLDHQLIDKDVYIYPGSEMFVEPLDTEEPVKTSTQMQVYIRRWRPSQFVIDPLEEIILDTVNPDEMRKKISDRSEIPFDCVSIAKGTGSFPADISVLEIESYLDWNPAIKSISQSPFSMYDDGGVVYYKDASEKLMELSVEKKNELRKTESARLSKTTIPSSQNLNRSEEEESSTRKPMEANQSPIHLNSPEKKRRQELERKMCKFKLFGADFENEGQIMGKKIGINEDTPFPEAVKQAYELLGYSAHVPLQRCRLVKFDDYSESLDQSLDLEEFGDQTFGHVVNGARTYYSFALFLETRKENETFKKYNKGGMKLKLLMVDLKTGEVTPTAPIRAEHGWTVRELKEVIGELFSLNPNHMELVLEMYNDGRHLPNDGSSLRSEGLYRKHSVFVSCDPYESQKTYNNSLMCKHVEAYVNSILLNITLPPRQNKLKVKKDEEKVTPHEEQVPDSVPADEERRPENDTQTNWTKKNDDTVSSTSFDQIAEQLKLLLQEEKRKNAALERSVEQLRKNESKIKQQRSMESEELKRSLQMLQEEKENHKKTKKEGEKVVMELIETLEQQQKITLRFQQDYQREREEHQKTSTQKAQLEEIARQFAHSWRVSHKDVSLTREDLGRGAWGTVRVGVFREMRVAVKELHVLIRSESTLALLNREINTMSKLHHPNLLLFIGAVLDHPSGHPLIITEIMDTSLRRAYDKGQLTDKSTKLSVLRDTAAGLNYLHCHPDEIIHRDVSSANVLLESRGPNKWRAKLSDFGSANVARHAFTQAAGAAVYGAPESFVSLALDDSEEKHQTTKMDVFSYGVLLCEIMTRTFPQDKQTFRSMLKKVSESSPPIVKLIQSCIHKDPVNRPTMKQVIKVLDKQF